ncbi:GyrI-like domain-containing protein [Brevibacillus sp. AY1]|uniref:GyrI-like domain-containing protein n=1 Tax=Brevibacillus sp. AY1 TaxID=2807621 RepID=UPI002455E9A2|nr:GyrI-like domain-containing protein [Brevibacillus sp. AY1]MDH4617000.1 GyrI-like domain-containing protein [Brevibacillus sp. AY1]
MSTEGCTYARRRSSFTEISLSPFVRGVSWKQQNTIGLPVTYGVFVDPPNYNPDTDPFSWIAGVEVLHDAEPPEGMISYELPKATYAVLDYKGDIDRAGDAYGQLYDWITQSEYVQAGSYGFEMYSKVYSMTERQNAEFSLYFPVRKK